MEEHRRVCRRRGAAVAQGRGARVGGWWGTLGTYDLKSGSKGSRGKSDGTCLGEKRCSREAIDLTKPDVIRQCWEVFLVGRSLLCDGADPILW